MPKTQVDEVRCVLENTAEKIRTASKYRQRDFDVPLSYKIAEFFGLKVQEIRLENTSGSLHYKTVPPTIIINKLHNAPRKNFTCAHEIGHYLLQAKRIDGISGDTLSNLKKNEIESLVDNFASRLLISEQELDEIIYDVAENFDHRCLEKHAKLLGVSLEALIKRFPFSKKYLSPGRFILIFKKKRKDKKDSRIKWRVTGRIISENVFPPINISIDRLGITPDFSRENKNEGSHILNGIKIRKGAKWISNDLTYSYKSKIYFPPQVDEYLIGFFNPEFDKS